MKFSQPEFIIFTTKQSASNSATSVFIHHTR